VVNGERMQKRVCYVGIDWGSEEHAIHAVDQDGVKLGSRRVKNDASALDAIVALTGGADPTRVYVGVETRRLAIVDALMARGYLVYSLNPKQADRFRDRFSPAGAKSDALDAEVICSSLRTDMKCFRFVEPQSAATRKLQATVRVRERTNESFQVAANQLSALVLIALPTLTPLCKGADEKWFWVMLEELLASPSMNLGNVAISTILKRHRIKRHSVDDIRHALDERRIPIVDGVRESAEIEARQLIALLRLLEMQAKAAEKAVEEALASLPKRDGKSDAEIVMSMPGVGPVTGAALLVEGHQALATLNLQQLRALAGVAPVTQSTGLKEKKKKKLVTMRRSSSLRLRNAMHCAANVARDDDRFRHIYANQRASGAPHGHACRVVADRMLGILVAMLRDRTEFRSSSSPLPS